jgi:peptidoglycan hydrolase-like protein with peptidoglycan-binding domain
MLSTPLRRRVTAFLAGLLIVVASAVPALPGPTPALFTIATAHAAGPTKLGDRGLRTGMRGRDVKDLQRLLNRAGFRTPISGNYARHTARSVAAFQRAAGLDPSGVVGRRTVRALRGAAASGGMAPMATPAETSASRPATAPVGGPAPGQVATISQDGLAVAPSGAPQVVVDLISAGNEIATTPYRYGGGHGSFYDDAYDCSGSVGYALHGAGLLDHTVTSGDLESWGVPGPGSWITVYANADHTFLVVAGIRFDTSGQKRTGSRWQPMDRSTDGFVVRHADGL